jgi:hypothetical protein
MKRYLLPSLAFLFPLLYYFRFVYPNTSLLLLQNDFGWLYFVYKGYLVDSLAHGHLPLWSPAEGGGYSFFGDPFTAILYPLNILPLITRLLVGNYNYWFHQIFTVLGVCIFALGVYRWLNQVFGKPLAALFTSMTLTACWSMGEFMRFPNAIHTIAWVPWILSAIHSAHHSPRLRPVYLGMFAVFCQITAGYPYFVVYSFCLYLGYMLYLRWLSPGLSWREQLIRQGALLVVPTFIGYPYLKAVSQILRVTTDRAGGDFDYATLHQFGPIDLMGAVVFPPVSSIEGCFYAGILTVFLIVLYLWRSQDTREKVAVVVGIMGFIALILGFRSYIFTLFWSFIPVVNQMRVFGRMTIALLPLLGIAIHQGFTILSDDLDRNPQQREIRPRVVGLVLGIVFLMQVFLYCLKDSFNQAYISLQASTMPGGTREIDFLMYTIFTAAVLLFAMSVDWSKLRHARVIVFAIFALLVTQDAGTQGRFLWTYSLSSVLQGNGLDPSKNQLSQAWTLAKRNSNFYRLIRDYFTLERTGDAIGLTADGLTKVPMENFYFDRYMKFYRHYGGSKDLLNQVMGRQKLFFHSSLHDDLPEFLADTKIHEPHANQPSIEYFDGNELRLSVVTTQPGYLTWIDNFDSGWKAEIDGARSPIELSLTTFKAVWLDQPGPHRIRFVYRPVIPVSAYGPMALGLAGLTLLVWWDRKQRRPDLTHPSESASTA